MAPIFIEHHIYMHVHAHWELRHGMSAEVRGQLAEVSYLHVIRELKLGLLGLTAHPCYPLSHLSSPLEGFPFKDYKRELF